ncbi:MAG: hypothetical protein C4335_02910 [Armatimonadota bacterium]
MWLIPVLAVELGADWAEGWANLPAVWMLIGLLGSLAGSGWAPFGTGVAVTLVSATNTLSYLVDERKLLAFGWGFAGLVVLLFVTAYLTALWYRQDAPARNWWLWTVWVQTGLTWVKFLPEVLLKPDERFWLVRCGAGGVVEISFVILSVILTAWCLTHPAQWSAQGSGATSRANA